MDFITFPANFVWGTATSAYQIEGGFNADGRGLSTWDEFVHKKGKIKDGSTGNIACDHYHKYKEDIELIENLGTGAYRFSLSWPRIQPTGSGKVNKAGLDFYDRLIDMLLEKKINPFITLFHWDLPLELHHRGGWTARETTDRFADYCEIVATQFGDRVQNWITLNEPILGLGNCGYQYGVHAPGIADYTIAQKVKFFLLLAHGKGFKRIKAINASLKVGIAEAVYPAYPLNQEDEALLDMVESHRYRLVFDLILKGHFPPLIDTKIREIIGDVQERDFDTIRTPLDFVGLHNYSRIFFTADPKEPFGFRELWGKKIPGKHYTAMDWEVFPEGMYRMVTDFRTHYGDLPIYITENGAAFQDELVNGHVHDSRRLAFLQEYLAELARAINAGCNVKGYFAWSLMDNFEWAEGFSKRFGLIYVDYTNLKRYPKDSYHWYAKVCRDNGFQL